jgi:hypothetical protein
MVVLQTTNHVFNPHLHTSSLPRFNPPQPPRRTPSPNLLILSRLLLILSSIISTIPILQPQYLDLSPNLTHLFSFTQRNATSPLQHWNLYLRPTLTTRRRHNNSHQSPPLATAQPVWKTREIEIQACEQGHFINARVEEVDRVVCGI